MTTQRTTIPLSLRQCRKNAAHTFRTISISVVSQAFRFLISKTAKKKRKYVKIVIVMCNRNGAHLMRHIETELKTEIQLHSTNTFRLENCSIAVRPRCNFPCFNHKRNYLGCLDFKYNTFFSALFFSISLLFYFFYFFVGLAPADGTRMERLMLRQEITNRNK